MALDVVLGVAYAVSAVATLGGSTAFKNGISKGLKQMGQDALKKAQRIVKNALNSNFKDIVKKAKEKVKEKLKELAESKAKSMFTASLKEDAMQTICGKIWDSMAEKTKKSDENKALDKVVDAVDFFNIK